MDYLNCRFAPIHHILLIICVCFFIIPSSCSSIAPLSVPDSYHRRQSPPSLIKSACNSTSNPEFCNRVLREDNRTDSSTLDQASLAVIALDLAVHNATNALLRLNHMTRRLKILGKNVNRTMTFRVSRRTKVVKACKVAYKVVAASFRSALAEAEDGDFMTANYDMKIAADDSEGCGKALVDGRANNSSLLWKMQSDLLCFSDIGFEITYSL